MTKKVKYFYGKNGKRISKAEHERRLKISESLKKRNAKARRETLKRNNARTIERKSSRKTSSRRKRKSNSTFTVKRKRTKVKTFPRKDSKDFIYTDKRYYELDVPLIIENEVQARNIASEIENVREGMKTDLLSGETKNRLVNIGYDISLTFQSKDKKKSKEVNIDKVCYTPSVLIKNGKDFDAAFELLQTEIKERFQKYFTKSGFGGELGIRGFETEISNEEIKF